MWTPACSRDPRVPEQVTCSRVSEFLFLVHSPANFGLWVHYEEHTRTRTALGLLGDVQSWHPSLGITHLESRSRLSPLAFLDLAPSSEPQPQAFASLHPCLLQPASRGLTLWSSSPFSLRLSPLQAHTWSKLYPLLISSAFSGSVSSNSAGFRVPQTFSTTHCSSDGRHSPAVSYRLVLEQTPLYMACLLVQVLARVNIQSSAIAFIFIFWLASLVQVCSPRSSRPS